jgi:putative component of membrane protein insertase Oxa1/YidC/SpoIIIJ protein YidD
MTVKKIFTTTLIYSIQAFRYTFGPAQQVCPFTVGCTEYAIEQIQTQPVLVAWKNILDRLLRCNPITNFFKKNN